MICDTGLSTRSLLDCLINAWVDVSKELLKFGISRKGEFVTTVLSSKFAYLRKVLHFQYLNALFNIFKFSYYFLLKYISTGK